jgi:hypothetical protein
MPDKQMRVTEVSMEYLVLLPNKIVAFCCKLFSMMENDDVKEHITATSFEMKNSEMKIFIFVKIKINGILRRCPYFLIKL